MRRFILLLLPTVGAFALAQPAAQIPTATPGSPRPGASRQTARPPTAPMARMAGMMASVDPAWSITYFATCPCGTPLMLPIVD